MKTLGCLFLLVAMSAVAQEPEVTGFTRDGSLSWTAPYTTGVFGVEWTLDLAWSWMPGVWNRPITSHVMNVDVQLDALGDLDSSFPEISEKLNSVYFRVVSSPFPLSERIVTNTLRVSNSSTGTLTNVSVWVGREFNKALLTNMPALATGEVSPPLQTSQPFGSAHLWYVYYGQ